MQGNSDPKAKQMLNKITKDIYKISAKRYLKVREVIRISWNEILIKLIN